MNRTILIKDLHIGDLVYDTGELGIVLNAWKTNCPHVNILWTSRDGGTSYLIKYQTVCEYVTLFY